jgi:transcriptional regulator with XRE-family HTH domain
MGEKDVGLSVAEVAQMLKRPPEEIEAWESGEDAPTYPQLEKLAYQIYKRPLAVFFLPVSAGRGHAAARIQNLAGCRPARRFREIPTCIFGAPMPTRSP